MCIISLNYTKSWMYGGARFCTMETGHICDQTLYPCNYTWFHEIWLKVQFSLYYFEIDRMWRSFLLPSWFLSPDSHTRTKSVIGCGEEREERKERRSFREELQTATDRPRPTPDSSGLSSRLSGSERGRSLRAMSSVRLKSGIYIICKRSSYGVTK